MGEISSVRCSGKKVTFKQNLEKTAIKKSVGKVLLTETKARANSIGNNKIHMFKKEQRGECDWNGISMGE